MAGINFLPSDSSKGSLKEEKKIRTIEFTSPSASQDKQKGDRHGGVLSIFKRKEKPYSIPPPLPKGLPSKEAEPLVASHMPGPKKTVTKFVQVEQKKPEQAKISEKKKTKSWFSRLFSRKERLDILSQQKESATQETEKPSYARVPQAPPPPQKRVSMAGAEQPKKIFEPTLNQGASTQSSVPPRFDPFSFKKTPQPKVPASTVKESLPVVQSQPAQGLPAPAPVQNIEHKYTDVRREAGPLAQGLSFDVNLVPDELAQRKRSMSRLNLLWLVIAMSIFVVGAGYGILEFYKQNVSSQAAGIENDLSRVNNQIIILEPIQRDALVLKKRTEEITRILQKQPLWTQFFEGLEANTLASVQIAELSVDANGSVTISARAQSSDHGFEQLEAYERATDFVREVRMTQLPTIPVAVGSSESPTPLPTELIPGGIPVETPSTPQPGTSETVYSSFKFSITLNPDVLFHTPTP